MSIALLVITDGRTEYLGKCIESANKRLRGPISEMWLYDDTGDEGHREYLARRFPDFRHINAGPRQGFAGAIAYAWDTLSRLSEADHVFHLEGDFTFNRDVDLVAMRETLDMHPNLAHMALRRQAWAPAEIEAGGVVELHPDAYTDVFVDVHQRAWLEHRLFWTTNPSLIRMSLVQRGWPVVPESERRFTEYLLREGTSESHGHELKFGYWGRREDAPWVHHLGDERVGHGY